MIDIQTVTMAAVKFPLASLLVGLLLSIGSQYCVGSDALQISPDGQCGGNFTCLGSAYGDCCSPHGW
jgi:hypothetical protein